MSLVLRVHHCGWVLAAMLLATLVAHSAPEIGWSGTPEKRESKAEKGDAKKVKEKLEQHASERAKLERQAWEIAHQEEIETEQSNQLRQKIGETEEVVAKLRAELGETTSRLSSVEKQATLQMKENKVAFTEAQDSHQHGHETLDKASPLAAEIAKEREKAEYTVAELADEEQEARNHLAKINEKETAASPEQEPAVIDVHQQTRHTIDDPQPEAMTHIEEGQFAPVEEKGVIGQGIDFVKNTY